MSQVPSLEAASLRDLFAAFALGGLIVLSERKSPEIVKAAWAFADLMLLSRNGEHFDDEESL